MYKIFASALFIMLFPLLLHALPEKEPFGKLKPSLEDEYVITLLNGDEVSGYIIEFVTDSVEGEGVKVRTQIGRAVFFANQINEIIQIDEFYRHSSRIFLLPSAEPISKNHFIGAFEGLFLYMGAGIGNWLSITAGRTIVPIIPADQQVSDINVKFTLLSEKIDDISRSVTLAVGGNLAFINSWNRLIHIYTVGSVRLSKSIITAGFFYKLGSEDFYTVKFDDNTINMKYENGNVGIALGLDTRIGSSRTLHFIGELWNSNITKPTNTAVLLGLRLAGQSVSADFGLAFFTQPFAAPFMSFVFTPF